MFQQENLRLNLRMNEVSSTGAGESMTKLTAFLERRQVSFKTKGSPWNVEEKDGEACASVLPGSSESQRAEPCLAVPSRLLCRVQRLMFPFKWKRSVELLATLQKESNYRGAAL